MKNFLTSRILISCISCAIVLGLATYVGLSIRGNKASVAITNSTTTTTTTTSTSTTTTTTTLPPVLIQPSAVSLPAIGPNTSLTVGSKNPNIALYEQRLSDLKFDPGTIDETYDQKTNFAVQSFQKISGLAVTGRLGDAEVTAMNNFQYPQPYAPGESTRFEVNLDNQVGILFQNYQVRLITTVSTGSQKSYSYVSEKTHRRVSSVANTPTGKFAFYRRAKGWEKSDLGRLYNPVYFKGGVAVHGYPQVPPKPASHGCVRIPMYISEYFPSLVSNGDAVYVYGSKEVAYVSDRVGDVVQPPSTTTTLPTSTQDTIPPVPSGENTTPGNPPPTT